MDPKGSSTKTVSTELTNLIVFPDIVSLEIPMSLHIHYLSSDEILIEFT